MNREILFKAKRKDNGEWIQGYYYQIWQPLPEPYRRFKKELS